MKNAVKVIEINDPKGKILESEWLKRSERIHRQLRPLLPKTYFETMERVFATGGRMCIAVVDNEVTGVAVYRIYENTADRLMMYVDDLVTDEVSRSKGVGKVLLDHLKASADGAGCDHIKLDSGTQRQKAHKFYFREGMTIVAFHFLEALKRKI